MNNIQFTNFTFCYYNLAKPSLENINLEIKAGEKILITGRSGSGKSTLLHCMNGIIPHSTYGTTSGEIDIAGINPLKSDIFKISNTVGTILQDQDSQFIGLSVGEDVAFSLENLATDYSKMQSIVENSLGQVDMLDFINHSPYELSGGQKQSVSLAGILASSPEILLFDEPLANLDPQSTSNITKLIRELNQDTRKTIIIAEHRIEECLEIGIDRIIVMDEGQIIAISPPHKILSSGILHKLGIREPLYIEAMRHASLNELKINNQDDIYSLTPEQKSQLEDWANLLPQTQAHESSKHDNVLQINNLSFSHDGIQNTLSEINLSINQGEIISILGNNGAGKSTLTQVIMGIYQQQTGDIKIFGESINHLSIRKRGEIIAVIMQNPNSMIIKNTVWEEVAFGLSQSNLSKEQIEQKISEVLKTCSLWGYRNWPISALSYGQKKRVTIASMLVLSPKILILDEPTAGQDLKTYHEFMEFIASLASSGMAIMIITHDLYLALEYTQRSVILHNGKIIADGEPYHIFSNIEIMQEAHLKEISLVKLAKLLDINSRDFIQKFIAYKQYNS